MADSDIKIIALTVTAGLGLLMAEWVPNASPAGPLPYVQIDHYEVYVSSTNDRATAVKVADSDDRKYPLPVLDTSVVEYFWVRAIDTSAQAGDFYPLSATAGVPGSSLPVGIASLASDLSAWQQRIGNSTRDALTALQQVQLQVLDISAKHLGDVQTLRSELGAQFAGITSKYSDMVELYAGPSSAMALRITSLEATVPNLATSSAVQALSATVTQQGNTITSQSSLITVLQNTLVGYDGTTTVASAVLALSNTVNTKNVTFRQSGTPTALAAGDTWIDTGNGNVLKVATASGTGSWVTAQDGAISVAQSAIVALQAVTGYSGGQATFRLDNTYTPSSGWTSAAALMTRLLSIYSTGNATITAGSKNVTGSGTSWSASAAPGDTLVGTNGVDSGVVSTVNSNTSITLVANWSGASQTTASYQVQHGYNVAGLVLESKVGASRALLMGQSIVLCDSSGNIYSLFDASGQYLLGGRISADTLTVDKLEIGARKFSWEGIRFEYNDPVSNQASWTGGTVRYVKDDGTLDTLTIAPGNTATWSSGVIYIYWVKGASAFSSTTTAATAFTNQNVVVATYKGGKNVSVTWGRTTIDGSTDLKGLSVQTDRMDDNSITGTTATSGSSNIAMSGSASTYSIMGTRNVPITTFGVQITGYYDMSGATKVAGDQIIKVAILVTVGGTDYELFTQQVTRTSNSAFYFLVGVSSLPGPAGTYTYKLGIKNDNIAGPANTYQGSWGLSATYAKK